MANHITVKHSKAHHTTACTRQYDKYVNNDDDDDDDDDDDACNRRGERVMT